MAGMDENRGSRFRFGLRTLFEVVAVAAFVLTLIYYRTTGHRDNWRYQINVNATPTGQIRQKWIIDTQTGQTWRYNYSSKKWQDEGAPPIPTN
jgi:hypothetical protein